MVKGMATNNSMFEKLSDFLQYLADDDLEDGDRLPSLNDLGSELDISVSRLREQLEVARALGIVEVKPKRGIRRKSYSFAPAINQSLAYAMAITPDSFNAYSDLRKHVEMAYWYQAVSLLTLEDHNYLNSLVNKAFEKLSKRPVIIPHFEHRELHLTIYKKLNNVFVTGILEAYWAGYEATGLDMVTDFEYLNKIWQYHKKIVDSICSGDFDAGYKYLLEHTDLLWQRSRPFINQRFE
jgi:DNA-binding FadR family transcriptional regulator